MNNRTRRGSPLRRAWLGISVYKAVILLICGFIGLPQSFFSDYLSSSDVLAQNQPTTSTSAESSRTPLSKDAGVWNNGQAALWDLNIIDHFRLFGATERSKGHQPEQPINFSHKRHVSELKMECQFCHWSVAKSAFAAIPEVETCIGCHGVIVPDPKLATKSDPNQKTEIEKLKDYYARSEPIPWIKVHVMPDHVRFNHKRHVKAGVSCHECHGQVPEMDVVERVSSMKMGWCLDCHRQRGASIDCSTCHK